MSAIDFLWAIPVFGLLIFIHELGHFAVAKWFGVLVHEFALGFGPAVAGFTRGETRYNLRLVPLGGFVRMAGMEDGDQEDPRGFARKPLYARTLVVAAGPVMNFVLACLLFSAFLYFVGVEMSNAPVLGDVPITCQAVQNAKSVNVPCPAYAAGLKEGDRILSINEEPVAEWLDIRRLVAESEGKPVTFAIERGGQNQRITLNPIQSEGGWMVGIVASSQRESLGRAILRGPQMTATISVAWLGGLRDMIIGKTEAQLSGPVGITRTIAEQASQGWDNLLWLTAFLSINLGMFNLLPIPALDGSRLAFLAAEGLRGRRVDPQREGMVHFVGFLLLVGLMIVITYGEVIGR